MKLTAHMLVKNEENWIWFAIQSVLPFVDEVIIFDTGSTDNTVEIIKDILDNQRNGKSKPSTIHFFSKPINSRSDIVKRRQEMVGLTKTDWFLLVDGDEVWPEKSLKLLKQTLSIADDETRGVVVRTRNCVGDIFHYQPESAGKYRLKGRQGHLTIRAYRKDSDYSWRGEYPLEGYMDAKGNLLNDQEDHLLFIDTYYYHLTHLKRSNKTDSEKVIDRIKKYKYEIGLAVYEDEIPVVFNRERPSIVPDPFVSYTGWEKLLAYTLTPIKSLRRGLFH